jgi:hypothetical protein
MTDKNVKLLILDFELSFWILNFAFFIKIKLF